ncbi:hypothetical protein MTO96_039377, partial [Rhipicephalus appendiculatus]
AVPQFEKLKPSKNRLLTPFDMESVMLYGSYAFARAPGLVTMLTKGWRPPDRGVRQAWIERLRRHSRQEALQMFELK